MSERKPCIRCGRAIDAWSKSCPFCNWDQARSAASAAAEPVPVLDYRPPSEGRLRKRILMGVGGALLLVASFGIGTVINSDGTPDDAPPTIEEQTASDPVAVSPALRANTQLVPMTGDAQQQQQPITTAPAAVPQSGLPTEYARHDATAASSEEYRALAQRVAEEEKKRNTTGGVVDPRSITGRAYTPPPVPAPAPRRAVPPTPARTAETPAATAATPTAPPIAKVSSTRPVPEYQPVPDVRVSKSTTVRLQLIVGSNGLVREVSIRDTVPGQTAKIVSAVQRWRFKPATSNGVPVEAPYNVEIWFKND